MFPCVFQTALEEAQLSKIPLRKINLSALNYLLRTVPGKGTKLKY